VEDTAPVPGETLGGETRR